MIISHKNYYAQLCKLLTAQSPQGRRKELEEQIEEADIKFRLHSLGQDNCEFRNDLHRKQARYMHKYGEYHKYGTYMRENHES
jgi:hypothetical protein